MDNIKTNASKHVIQIWPAVPCNQTYDYCFDQPVQAGQWVSVMFGQRSVIGLARSCQQSNYNKPLKTIQQTLELPPVSESFMSWIEKISAYIMVPVGEIVRLVLRGFSLTALKNYQQYHYVWHGVFPPGRMSHSKKQIETHLTANQFYNFSELTNLLGLKKPTLQKLVKDGIIQKEPISWLDTSSISVTLPDNFSRITLSKEQKSAVIPILTSLDQRIFKTFLLDGITGSGKTEVYLTAVAHALSLGKQVLILLPEIALTTQTVKRFEDWFQIKPLCWHSGISSAQRQKHWLNIACGKANIILGARSALFLPFLKLGLIIIDEEHDSSFRQEDNMRYHARDLAVWRGSLEGFPVVLSSATPSLESYVNAEMGRYQRLVLRQRFGNAQLPDIHIIDMKKQKPPTGQPMRWISSPLRQAMQDCWARGEQAILFLNRRGYAPVVLCRACGWKLKCDDCDSWLVFYKQRYKIDCHQCGHSTKVPMHCPACGEKDTLTPCGPGIERVHEEIQQDFPDISTLIISSDNQNNPKKLQTDLQSIRNGQVQLIIGTQILAKGHHFPLVTCVGIIDADLGLAGGDLRASERTYQLLDQVSGRAGREQRQGHVFLQTHYPHHPAIRALAQRDRDSFLEQEAQIRADNQDPPFGRLAALILSSEDENQLNDIARHLAQSRPDDEQVIVWGPAIPPFAYLRKRWRLRFLIRTPRRYPIQSYITYWLQNYKIPKSIRVTIDIDPYNFL